MMHKHMHPGRIEEVKALSDDKIVNKHLEEGWMLLDARVIQLSPESSGQKAMAYYIVGRKGKSPFKKSLDELEKTKNQDE